MTTVVVGPPDSALSAPDVEDERVDLVQAAGAFVTFLAVARDRGIFVLLVEPA